jgi:PAS domain S-box-containing protein
LSFLDDFARTPDLLELFEQAPCGYVIAQLDGTLTRVNQTFLDLTGYTREALEGARRFQDLLPAASRAFYENQYAPLLRLQGFVKEVALELVTHAGGRVAVLVNAVQRPDASGQPIAMAIAVFEATDRRAYERELLLARRRAEELAAIVTASHDAILTVSVDGDIQTWNPAAEALFGRASGGMAGEPIAGLLPVLGDQAEWQRLRDELVEGRAVVLDTHGIGPDGHPIAVSVSLAAHAGLTGELATVSLIARDRSQYEALERQKDEFLAMVSHDLRSPVATIKGWAQLLIRRTRRLPEPERDSWRHDLATVETTAGRLASMIDELLDLTQLQLGRPLDLRRESVDLVALAKQTADEHQLRTETHVIEVQTVLDKLVGEWDRSRLERVLTNLLSNAVKYSPEGGRITVMVGREAGPSGDFGILSVRDTGAGIPADDIPRIFDRFYRARNVPGRVPGTGLGLAAVQQLVQQHGGSIAVESAVGVGSTFVVRLPLGAAQIRAV